MAGLRLTRWLVDEIVRSHLANPGACIQLNGYGPGPHRVMRDGRKWYLHRYLEYVDTGVEPDPLWAMLPGGCTTDGCLNPRHRIPSLKRTITDRRKKEYRDGR